VSAELRELSASGRIGIFFSVARTAASCFYAAVSWLRDASSRPRAAACAPARAPPLTTRASCNGRPAAKDPTRECFLSIPTVVGVQGAETVLEIRPHLNYAEAQKYDATADTLEHMCAQLPPAGPMTRTDALDAGAARKEAYEEAA